MAEVKFDIVAEDLATPTLYTVVENAKSAVSSMNTAFGQLDASAFQAGWQTLIGTISGAVAALAGVLALLDNTLIDISTKLDSIGTNLDEIKTRLDEPFTVTIKTEESLEAVKNITGELSKLDATKTLDLDASSAVQAVNEAKAAIDAIPDVSYKTVIVQYKTQASPVMDFSEGMAYIEERMASLPAEGTYTVNYENVPARGAVSDVQAPGGTARNISFSPTIQITSIGGKSGGELAAELDRALAEKWRYNRSELRRAMTA
jgi:hypothetical protein